MVNTETQNYKVLLIQGSKTSEMIGNEDRELSDAGRKILSEGLTCELKLKEERILQRSEPTACLSQETKQNKNGR